MSENFRDTLNLPKTEFSMKASLSSREENMINFWESKGIYFKMQEKRKKGIFVLHDGPPYSNEHIHLGTAMNKILKDIIIKYKNFAGYRVPYIPGWDNHGMPIENEVIKRDKKLNELLKNPVALKDLDVRKDIRKKCREFALKWVEIQKKEFKRLLCIGDWENAYLTMKPEYEAEELRIFAELVEKGYIERGFMPVHFCPTCRTALAMAEIEYRDKESPSLYFTMEFEKKSPFSKKTRALVWTTTPWTIISNLALAFHPDFDYIEIEVQGNRYFIAEPNFQRVKEELHWKDIKVHKRISGKELEGYTFKHPFMNRISKGILADFVTSDTGTGIVHIAPGHGKEDFDIGRKYGLAVFSPIDDAGLFTEAAGEFQGLSTESASLKVKNVLEKKGSLIKFSYILHSYPHCWRCKNPLIFKATSQWFLKVDHNNLRENTLKKIKEIKWIPEGSINRIIASVAERPNWCISRQRAWGVPIPALKCQNCENVFLDVLLIREFSEKVQEKGSDIWLTEPLEKITDRNIKCEKCGSFNLTKEQDILDVWIDSGFTNLIVLGKNQIPWPSDVYIEGPDQHRGWFNASLMAGMSVKQDSPYRICITHGWTLDAEGRAMSKSLGNVVSPLEIVKKYGAEILRLWVGSVEWTQDVRISEEMIKRIVEAYRKIRNTYRFILGNIYDFKLQEAIPFTELSPFDRYILHILEIKKTEWNNFYDNFEFHKFFKSYYNFCSIDLSAFYLDCLKDRLYVSSPFSKERKSAQTALYYLLKTLLVYIAPILSFTAEEAYQLLPVEKQESIFFEEIPEKKFSDEEIYKDFEEIRSIREIVLKAIEKLRNKREIGSSLETALFFEGKKVHLLKKYEKHLCEIFITSQVEFGKPEEFETTNENQDISVYVIKAKGEKCARCWMFKEDVGKNGNMDGLCTRCSSIVRSLKK